MRTLYLQEWVTAQTNIKSVNLAFGGRRPIIQAVWLVTACWTRDAEQARSLLAIIL